jgi:polyisoprenoid-binding protein YceI
MVWIHSFIHHLKTITMYFLQTKTAVMTILLLLSQGLMAQGTQSAATQWNVDGAHSSVKFVVTHLVISEVEGSFKVYSGSIESANEDFSDAKIEFAVDVTSVNTDNEMRDNHLRSDDFFSAEKYPKMTFKSTAFKPLGGNKYALEGDLTIRDVTRRVSFDVIYGGKAKDGYGNTKAGFKATTTINRIDYGLKWNMATEAGGLTVGEDVTLSLNLQFASK